MTKSLHEGEQPTTQNQNNAMSEDPKDGSRDAFKPGPDGKTPLERKPEHDRQDQEAIEAYGERGTAQGD